MIDELVEQIKVLAAAQADQIGTARHAIVSAVDPVSHSVKVMVQPEDIESGWIPDSTVSAGGLRIASPSELGSQVLVVPVGGDMENPVIVGKQYDVVTPPPISPLTGQPAQPGEYLLCAGQGVPPNGLTGSASAAQSNIAWLHILPASLALGAGNTMLTIINGQLTVSIGSTSFTFTASSLAAMGATITSNKDVLTGSVSLNAHTHPGVQDGQSSTQEPAGHS